jgi:hypothetical protein
MEAQLTLLEAVHGQPAAVETFTFVEPPAEATVIVPGLTVYVQSCDCTMEKRSPATAMVPARGAAEPASTEKPTVPLPVPLAPERTVIQLASDVALQTHWPLDALTTMLPLPPAGEKAADESCRLISQSVPDWTTRACWSLISMVP